MDDQKMRYLIGRVLNNSATREDFVELAAAIKADESGRLSTKMDELLREGLIKETGYDQEKWQRIADQILHADYVGEKQAGFGVSWNKALIRRMLPYAASITLILGVCVYLIVQNKRS